MTEGAFTNYYIMPNFVGSLTLLKLRRDKSKFLSLLCNLWMSQNKEVDCSGFCSAPVEGGLGENIIDVMPQIENE